MPSGSTSAIAHRNSKDCFARCQPPNSMATLTICKGREKWRYARAVSTFLAGATCTCWSPWQLGLLIEAGHLRLTALSKCNQYLAIDWCSV